MHLPSLTIRGFRGFRELAIPRLGRVTLIAGKNGVGKTTVLEAVHVYAARGRYSALADILAGREELAQTLADSDERISMVSELDWSALFHGRDPISHDGVQIGPGDGSSGSVALDTSPLEEDDDSYQWLAGRLPESHSSEHLRKFSVTIGPSEYMLPLVLHRDERDQYFGMSRTYPRVRETWPAKITCHTLGPGLPTNNDIAEYWSTIALTEAQAHAVEAVKLILGNEVQDVAVVPSGPRHTRRESRRGSHRVIVSLANRRRPVPLKSLGDGAVRAFTAALGLAHSRNGFLLVDEAENGIHHSVQRDFWKMVLRSAQRSNVQVFATTHSWDTVRGFAEAVAGTSMHDGLLVRLDKYEDGFRVVSYSDDRLTTVAEQGIEPR